jgi:hypothetical protein
LHRNVANFERQLMNVKAHARSPWQQERSRRPHTSGGPSTIMSAVDISSGGLARLHWPVEERTVQQRVSQAQGRPATRGIFDAVGTPLRHGREPCRGGELIARCRGSPSRTLKSTSECLGGGGGGGDGGAGGAVDCSFSNCADLEALLHSQMHAVRKLRAGVLSSGTVLGNGARAAEIPLRTSRQSQHSSQQHGRRRRRRRQQGEGGRSAAQGRSGGSAPRRAMAAMAGARSLGTRSSSGGSYMPMGSTASSSSSSLPVSLGASGDASLSLSLVLPSAGGGGGVATLRLANNELTALDDAGAWMCALLHVREQAQRSPGGSVLRADVGRGSSWDLGVGALGAGGGGGDDGGDDDGGDDSLSQHAPPPDPIKTLLADALRRLNRRIVDGAAAEGLASEEPLLWGGGARAGRAGEAIRTRGAEALAHVKILDLSCNALRGSTGKPGGALAPLARAGLDGVTSLLLHSNKLARLEDVDALRTLPRLRALTLHSNPLCQTKHYRAKVLARLPRLVKLDMAPVTAADRDKAATWVNLNETAKKNRRATKKSNSWISPWGTV